MLPEQPGHGGAPEHAQGGEQLRVQPLEPRRLPPRARAVLGGVEQSAVEVSTKFRESYVNIRATPTT